MHAFRLTGIDHEPFEELFSFCDDRLAELGAVRVVATKDFGFPCRVSLEDARVGDELLLLRWEHQPVESPYRSSGPIYVRRGGSRRTLDVGEVPPYVTRRLMSLRAYDAEHMMVDADVCDGPSVAAEIDRMLEDERVAYVHLHNAKRGCYSCRVDRV